MQRESKKFLFDIVTACRRIAFFTAGKTLDDYRADDLLKSAVERQFEIVGEALSQLYKIDVDTARTIPDYQRIIAFRNILIHGYATIHDHAVWGVIEGDLPKLLDCVDSLLASP
jgi:uncharacterized protein with HEPN domain